MVSSPKNLVIVEEKKRKKEGGKKRERCVKREQEPHCQTSCPAFDPSVLPERCKGAGDCLQLLDGRSSTGKAVSARITGMEMGSAPTLIPVPHLLPNSNGLG